MKPGRSLLLIASATVVVLLLGGGLALKVGAEESSYRQAVQFAEILSLVTEGEDLDAHAELVPLVAGKRAQGGRTTAYVCKNRVCAYPTSDPQAFAKQLAEVERIGGEAVQ